VVQDQYDGESRALDKTAKLITKVLDEGWVHGGERLVAENKSRPSDQGPCDSDSLTLAAAEMGDARQRAVRQSHLLQSA
jgi:hypothetical protein